MTGSPRSLAESLVRTGLEAMSVKKISGLMGEGWRTLYCMCAGQSFERSRNDENERKTAGIWQRPHLIVDNTTYRKRS